MEKKVGIDGLKKVVKFGLSLGEGIAKSFEDGEMTFTDVQYMIDAMKDLPAAFGALDVVVPEAKDLDASEREELVKFVKADFDIADDKLEERIEQSLEMAVKMFETVKLWIPKK